VKNLLAVLLASLILMGCAERVEERSGITVELVPVTYTFKANIDKSNRSEFEERANQYLELHRDKVLTEQIYFTWSSKLAEKAAVKTREKLLLRGVDPKNVHISEFKSSGEPFNFTISLQQYQVIVPTCEEPTVNQFGFTNHDCFVEGMRWKSIQHPEKMIGTQAKRTDVDR